MIQMTVTYIHPDKEKFDMVSDTLEMNAGFQTIIRDLLNKTINGALSENVLTKNKIIEKPFHTTLVPDLILKSSHFERIFSTTFSSAWEELAAIAAKSGLGHAVRGYTISGTVKYGRLVRISRVLNSLQNPTESGEERIKPDWEQELAYIMAGGGEDIPVQIMCDVYAEDIKNNKKYMFELKAPLPNSDITKVSKEKLLKLYCMEPRQIDGAYFALPYNPFGRKENYAWSIPERWFNMKTDEVVLIGDEFWEKIGGLGTYQTFISAINEIGMEYKERIYRDFLEIDPPGSLDSGALK